MYVCMCVRMCERAYVCVCMCERAYVRSYICTFVHTSCRLEFPEVSGSIKFIYKNSSSKNSPRNLRINLSKSVLEFEMYCCFCYHAGKHAKYGEINVPKRCIRMRTGAFQCLQNFNQRGDARCIIIFNTDDHPATIYKWNSVS